MARALEAPFLALLERARLLASLLEDAEAFLRSVRGTVERLRPEVRERVLAVGEEAARDGYAEAARHLGRLGLPADERDIEEAARRELRENLQELADRKLDPIPDRLYRMLDVLRSSKPLRPIARSMASVLARVASTYAKVRGELAANEEQGTGWWEWVTVGDTHVRKTHRNAAGEVRRIGTLFSTRCRFPLDPLAPIEEVAGCRCHTRPALPPGILGFAGDGGSGGGGAAYPPQDAPGGASGGLPGRPAFGGSGGGSAGGGSGGGAGTPPGGGGGDSGDEAHRLILAALGGRRLTDEELGTVLEHVARAGFDPDARERARGALNGVEWEGRLLRGSDRIPPAARHHLLHVVVGREWPEGTDALGYADSIEEVVRDPESGVLVSRYGGSPQLTVVRRSKDLKGERGFDWVLVDYRAQTGHWTTAYQPRKGLAELRSPRREDVRWLRRPR